MLLIDLVTKNTNSSFYEKREKTTGFQETIYTTNKMFDLIAPEGQSAGADVQNYVRSQTRQHHGFVILGGRQLRPHDVQLPGQRGGAGRAGGRGAAELTGPVPVAEDVRARRDPGEAAQLGPTLWVVAQQRVVAERHGHDWGERSNNLVIEISESFTEGSVKQSQNM